MIGNGVGDVAQLFIGTEEIKAASEALKITKGADEFGGISNVSKLDLPGGPKSGSVGGPGAGKSFSNRIKAEAKAEANGKCVLCGDATDTGVKGKKGNTDHAIPKSRNGNNTKANAQHTCENCNQVLKKTMTTEEYLKQRGN